MKTNLSTGRIYPVLVGAGLSLLFAVSSAKAQDFPVKPVKLVLATAVGSTSDLIARVIIPEMSKALGQPIVQDYRVGAGNIIGFEYVAKAAPDGYTILLVTVSQLALTPVMVKDLRFDPLRDLPPFIGLVEGRSFLAASTKLPVRTFQEFVQYAKASPRRLSYSSAGASLQLPIEAIKQSLGLDILHVPYSASTAGYLAIATGEVDLGMVSESSIVSLGDKLKILALSGTRRHSKFPNVPTFTEVGFPQLQGFSYSLNAPRGTPESTVRKLYSAASHALRQPDVISQYAKLQLDIVDQPPEAAVRDLAELGKFFGELAAKVGIKPQ